MKKTVQITVFALLIVSFLVTPTFAQKTDYQIGEAEGGLLTDGKIMDAFQKAVDKFEEWMYEGTPSGYVTQQDGYYLQHYADKNNQKAAVYVGDDYKSYVLRGPIFEQLDTVGGLKTLGRPVSDAFEADGVWYQNFESGYATVPKDTGKAVFVKGYQVDEKGKTGPVTDGGGNFSFSSGTDVGDDKTDSPLTKPSEMVSDMVEDVKNVAPKWGMWLFIILLVGAVVVLAAYWFLKRK